MMGTMGPPSEKKGKTKHSRAQQFRDKDDISRRRRGSQPSDGSTRCAGKDWPVASDAPLILGEQGSASFGFSDFGVTGNFNKTVSDSEWR